MKIYGLFLYVSIDMYQIAYFSTIYSRKLVAVSYLPPVQKQAF